MKQPRPLVINGDPFNRKTPTGITLCNLFAGWDKSSIAQIYTFPVEPDLSICDLNWKLTRSQFPLMSLARLGRQILKGVTRRNTCMQELPQVTVKAKVADRPLLSAWADIIPLQIDAELLAWVEEFEPTLIYTNLTNIRIMTMVKLLSEKFCLPVVPHFMDDWPATRYNIGLAAAIPRQIQLSRMRSILLRSPAGMVISTAMAQEYQIKYGLCFEPFMNCVDFDNLSLLPSPNQDTGIRFAYVGGLHLNRWQSLLEIGNALAVVKNEGISVELVIFAPSADIDLYGNILTASPVISIGGSLQADEVMPMLQKFDVMVHIESFDNSDRLFTRLSISTKIPQYMASGRPIFAYGPPEVASCRYVSESECGLVVSQRDMVILTNSLRGMVVNADKRQWFGDNGRYVASKNHNSVIERERFRSLLMNLSNITA